MPTDTHTERERERERERRSLRAPQVHFEQMTIQRNAKWMSGGLLNVKLTTDSQSQSEAREAAPTDRRREREAIAESASGARG